MFKKKEKCAFCENKEQGYQCKLNHADGVSDFKICKECFTLLSTIEKKLSDG